MPDDLLDNTTETLEEAFHRLEDMVAGLVKIVEPLPGHINNVVSDIATLKLISAAKEVPATAVDVGDNAVDAAKSGIETGGAAVSTVPAAATDVLEDAGKVTGAGSKAASKATSSVWGMRIKKRRS